MQPHRNVGRNEPCWCGSGKKYKHCHMRADQGERAQQARNRHLDEQLDEFALGAQFKPELEKAVNQFYAKGFDIEDEEEQLFYFQRALDYFIHDYRLPDGQRVIERFAAQQDRWLSREERARLLDMLDSRLSVFEILDVRRGEGMRLCDVFTGEMFDVREKRGTLQVGRWQIVYTRLTRSGNYNALSGFGMRLQPEFRSWVRHYLQDLWDEYQDEHATATQADFLHDQSHLLNQFILKELMPAAEEPPTVLTMEGDSMEMARAVFEVRDRERTLAGLRAAQEFDEHAPSDESEVSFGWLETGVSLDFLRMFGPAFEYQPSLHGPGGVRGLGNVILKGEELVLETTSERRLTAGKALLSQRLGDAIRYRETTTKPVADILSGLSHLPLADIHEEQPPEIQELQSQLRADYIQRWLEMPIPALGGRTPRAAAQTFGGRIELIRLLKQFEGDERDDETSTMDVDALRRALGLSEQEFLDESDVEHRIKNALVEIEDLALEDRLDEAWMAWQRFRDQYPLRDTEDFEFAEAWDLLEIFDEAVREFANRLAMFRRFDEGIALLEACAGLNEDDADEYRADIAEMQVERGEADEGLRALQALVARNPGNFLIARTLADLYAGLLDRPDGALAVLRRLREQDGDEHADVYQEILEIYAERGRFEEAEQFWHAENDDDPDAAKDYLGWAKLRLAQGDYEGTREALSKVEREEARWYWAGMVESRAGTFALAREAWAGDLQEPTGDDWAFWNRWVELHLRLHDPDPIIAKVDPARMCDSAYCWFYLAVAHALKGELERVSELACEAHAQLQRRHRVSHVPDILHDWRILATELGLSHEAYAACGL